MFAPPKQKQLKAYEPKRVPSIRDLFGRFGERTKLTKYSVSDTETGAPLPVLSSKLDDIKEAEKRLRNASKLQDE